ncbi:hypothetical protein L484_016679 [Morus notabilis]|uniref:Uncharacterized protein n=1 Tax=Morus notabilis TaxID=981085 RepID=W9RP36_9ROSA|nr:hypothetical protein L484_016679 [Morus notabilis]
MEARDCDLLTKSLGREGAEVKRSTDLCRGCSVARPRRYDGASFNGLLFLETLPMLQGSRHIRFANSVNCKRWYERE